MQTLALIDPLWRLLHVQPGWRRTVGVIRQQLAGSSLVAYTHPDDVAWLLWWERHRRQVEVGLRIGEPGAWEPVLAQFTEPCAAGVAVLTIQHATGRVLPRRRWWLPEHTYAALPALPCTPGVSA